MSIEGAKQQDKERSRRSQLMSLVNDDSMRQMVVLGENVDPYDVLELRAALSCLISKNKNYLGHIYPPPFMPARKCAGPLKAMKMSHCEEPKGRTIHRTLYDTTGGDRVVVGSLSWYRAADQPEGRPLAIAARALATSRDTEPAYYFLTCPSQAGDNDPVGWWVPSNDVRPSHASEIREWSLREVIDPGIPRARRQQALRELLEEERRERREADERLQRSTEPLVEDSGWGI